MSVYTRRHAGSLRLNARRRTSIAVTGYRRGDARSWWRYQACRIVTVISLSTVMGWLAMNDDVVDSRYTASAPMTSGVPMRRAGCRGSSRRMSLAEQCSVGLRHASVAIPSERIGLARTR